MEYEHRVERAQKLMHEHDIDVLLLISEENVNYFSGYRTTCAQAFIKDYPPSILILPANGSPCLILSISMRGNAEAMSSVDDLRFLGWDGLENLTNLIFPKDIVKTTVRTIESEGLSNKTIGLELDRSMRVAISQNDFEGIKKGLPEATFVDAGQLIWEVRMVKSSLEVQHLRRSCEIACKGFRVGLESLKEGMSEKEFARAIYRGMLDAGCEDTPLQMWLNVKAGWDRYTMSDTRPTNRTFKKGDIVVLDGGTRYRGYFSDIARVACVGKPSKKQTEIYNIARQAQEIGIDNLRPGVHVRQVYASVMTFIKESGYNKYQMYEGIGHGIGLDFHEPPYFNSKSDVVLRPGMVVTVEPCMYDRPVIKGILEGDIMPAEGLFFIEDMVLVTDGKPEILSPLRKDLFVV